MDRKNKLTYSDEEIGEMLRNPKIELYDGLKQRAEQNDIFSEEEERGSGIITFKEEIRLFIILIMFGLAVWLIDIFLYYFFSIGVALPW